MTRRELDKILDDFLDYMDDTHDSKLAFWDSFGGIGWWAQSEAVESYLDHYFKIRPDKCPDCGFLLRGAKTEAEHCPCVITVKGRRVGKYENG